MTYPALKVIHGNTLRRPAEWHSFAKLGPGIGRLLQVPIGLTDRDTGTVWYLYAAPQAVVAEPPWTGKDRIGISTVPPDSGLTRPRTFAPYSEPHLGDTGVRLIVRGGRLGYDSGPGDGALYAGARCVFKGLTGPFSTRYELKAGVGFTFGAALSFETDVADW